MAFYFMKHNLQLKIILELLKNYYKKIDKLNEYNLI